MRQKSESFLSACALNKRAASLPCGAARFGRTVSGRHQRRRSRAQIHGCMPKQGETAQLKLIEGGLRRGYFFGGAMVSLAALATRNFTTVLALILIGSPVCGLRPMRALRSAFTSLPRSEEHTSELQSLRH